MMMGFKLILVLQGAPGVQVWGFDPARVLTRGFDLGFSPGVLTQVATGCRWLPLGAVGCC